MAEPLKQFNFRLGKSTTDALDATAEWLAKETGQPQDRTTALRHLAAETANGRVPFLLPNYGPIPCGKPVRLDEPAAEKFDVRSLFRGDAELYALVARGTSMAGKGIIDGDYLIVRKVEVPDHGQVVAAWVNGEVTLKTFHIRKKGRTTEYWLYPANDEHEPIFLDPKGDNRVMGVLVGVIRKV